MPADLNTRPPSPPPSPTPGRPSRPPLPKWKLPPPVRAGLWARTPPAVFPAVLGLAGLAVGWRRGAGAFGAPVEALAEIFTGAVTLLVAFALLTIIVKIARRPGVVAEDLRILPGRAGMAAAVLSAYLLAILLAPHAILLARGLFWVTLGAQLALIVMVLRALAAGPIEQRRVTPAFHLSFTGLIVGALAALNLGMTGMAAALFWPSLAAALAIWAVSAAQFAREVPPAPLRPLLAIHLAPVALIGTVALGLGMPGIALAMGIAAAVLLAALVIAVRWLLIAGFTPFWGALTFPLAATVNLWLGLGWQMAGGTLLVAATLVIIPIAFQVMKMWASGQLAIKTNAAVA